MQVHLPAGQKAGAERTDSAVPGVRLSPVELRNLALIDDPALDGVHRGDVSGCASAGTPPVASPVCMEDDPTVLGRVVNDEVVVGPGIATIKTGQDGPVAHERVIVSPDNPHFSTDGSAIYAKDGSELVCMVVPCERYRVQDGCRRIGPRAFDAAESLRVVELPDGIEGIGRLAFAKSGIRSVRLPDSVREVEEKAFYGCRSLKSCQLGSGLQEVGALAFALSGVEHIALPSSVRSLAPDAFDKTPAMRAACTGAIEMDEGNGRYVLDEVGGLYEEGRFAGLLSCVTEYAVAPGCEEVLPRACCRNPYLRAVALPEGLVRIGNDAFRGCKNLERMDLPSSIRSIGAHAFMDTRIRTLRLGARVSEIGEGALLVAGENPVRTHEPLASLELDAANARFYLESGLLCERGAGDGGADKVLLYVGPDACVRIPDAVNRIAPYALMGATDIDELFMHGHMHSICAGALSVARSIPKVTVEVPLSWVPDHEDAPADEKHAVTLPVPSISPRFRTFTDLFTAEGGCTRFVFPYYDAWATCARSVEELAPAALARLREPIWLPEETRELYQGIMRRKQVPIAKHFAEKGDLAALEDLVAWSMLEAEAVEDAIAEATEDLQPQALACLLELKQRMGRGSRLDLSI